MKLGWHQLSDEKISRVSDISADFGNVMLASVVLPAILDKLEIILATAGIALTLFFWIISIALLK